MKAFWVDVRPWKKDLATVAIESGADALVVDHADAVRELGRVTTIAPDGDLVPDRDVFEIEISGQSSEAEAVQLAQQGYVIVRTPDWTVIPLENLIARSDRIVARVKDEEEAELALHILEKGVDAILLKSDSPETIRAVAGLVHHTRQPVPLVPFTITAVRNVGMGDRVCVDTCSLLQDGEGLLVGNTSSAFLLVHAETLENPYVAPRPFRVNAGAVHAYVLQPDGKTSYLSELKTGERVMVIDAGGTAEEAVIGRVKIERRPLLVIEAEREEQKLSLVLQNAETIRLVREDGSPCSVVDVQPGDHVLGAITKGGRHFGVAVEETIIEK